MDITSRLLLIVAAIFCALVYILPIWSITLYAPQYSDGIGMHILVDDVVGHEKHDIKNINILNHYIGMKPIERSDFPEFEYMPWIFGLLILLILASAITGKRSLVIAWLIYMLLIAIVGMIRFYYWGYEFGHDLNPQAPIKVPGMSYQPPLIGSKQLLNITAHSWPASASYALLGAKLTGLIVLYRIWPRK